MRQRFYVDQMKAGMSACDRQLEEKEMCAAEIELCELVAGYPSLTTLSTINDNNDYDGVLW